MAEHKKLSMLVKLDDGQTYTLGGDGADNAVTLDTDQTITGLKTFDKLPQSSVKPANDHDLVNKVYVDALKPKLKTTVMLNVESESTVWAAFHSIKFSTTTGKFIEPVYLEDTLTSTAVEPLKFVFKLADSFTGNATAKNKDFFKDYQLKDGEYFGSFTPSHLLEARWSTHTINQQANPFSNYLAYLTTGPNSVLPFLEYHFDGLSDELKQVEFDIGDIYNSNGYPPEKFQFVVSTGAKEFTSKVYTRAADSIGQGSHHTVEFKLKALEYVTLDTKQEIAGSKTFSENIKVTAKPKEATDVATVGYVSGLLNAKAPYDVTLDFKVEDDTDGGWVVYSNMEINLDNGKKLKCIHIDNTQPTSANAPVKAVFKAIPATEVINAAPAEQAPTFFDTYQLQDEEYLGTLTYGHILNPQLQDYSSYKGPFHTNQYGTTCTIKEATQLRISISELPAAVSKVSLKFDSSYLPKTFKASMSGVGMDVTSNVLTNPSGNTPLELLFDIVKLTGLVTLDTAQTITGAKTFEKLPKSEATPVDDHELVNKAYVDSLHPKKETSLTIFGSFFDNKSDGGTWISYSDLKISLVNGAHLVPIYLENTAASHATEPVKVIFKVSNTPYVANSVQAQAKDWFDTYVLKEDECLGSISYARVLDIENVDSHNYANLSRPFDEMLVMRVKDLVDMHGEYPMIKFTVEGLPAKFSTVNITIATPNYTSNPPYSLYVLATDGDNSYKSKVYNKDDDNFSADASNLTKLSIPIGLADPSLVTLHTQQELTALKTFKVLPQSEAVPADDKDLVNKKYVDEKVGAGGTGGAAPANMVTTDTAQNITEVKTFDKLPKSSVEPTDDTELVNKKYVDSVCPQPLQGYEVTLYATAKTGNSHVGINGLTLFFGNGQKLVPAIIEGANDYSFAPSDARIIWTLDTSVVAKQVAKTEIDQHVLVDGEIDGRIQASYTLGGKFTNNKYDQFFMGGQMRLGSAGVTDEQPFAKLIVNGPIAPITKITLTSDYEADKIPASVRATVCQIGGEIKESKPVSITAINQNVELTLEKTFEPDSYYVNRFDDQDVLGVKKFGSVPTIKKNNALYGIGRSDTPALFGDLSGSIALPVPQKQMLNIAFGTKTTQNGIGSNATYTHVTSAVVGALKLKIRRPNDLVEEELYLKAHGPSTNGYRGILTNKKPSNYPNQIEVMDQSTMDGYKLKVGEYFTKLAFNSSTSENAWQDKLLEQAEKSGSNMLPNVFAASASTFFTHTNTDKFGNGSASVAFRLFIYDCPMITSWAYDDQSAESSGSSISLYSGDGSRNKGYTQENILNNHFAKDIPELNMQTTNVLAAIAALEARIKALEDAAPKP